MTLADTASFHHFIIWFLKVYTFNAQLRSLWGYATGSGHSLPPTCLNLLRACDDCVGFDGCSVADPSAASSADLVALLPALCALIVGELGAEAEACPGDLMPLLAVPLVVKRDWVL